MTDHAELIAALRKCCPTSRCCGCYSQRCEEQRLDAAAALEEADGRGRELEAMTDHAELIAQLRNPGQCENAADEAADALESLDKRVRELESVPTSEEVEKAVKALKDCYPATEGGYIFHARLTHLLRRLDRDRQALKGVINQLHECVDRAEAERDALRAELVDAYAEMRKQWPAITAIFDREVWDRARLDERDAAIARKEKP